MNDDLIKRLERWGADEGLQNHFIGSRSARRDCAEAAAALAEARAEIARLREALGMVRDGDVPRPVVTPYRADGVASKNDRCNHGFYMYEDCAGCIEDFARAALEPRTPDTP